MKSSPSASTAAASTATLAAAKFCQSQQREGAKNLWLPVLSYLAFIFAARAGGKLSAMRKYFFALFLALFAVMPAVAQQLARPDVADKLSPPATEKLILQAHATGDQIYVCQPGPDQKLAWTLKAPDAQLFDAQDKLIAKHFAGPTWKHTDGSEVVGKPAARLDSPDATAIPWLLLTAASHSGDGAFSKITFIQRLHTKGGQPPQSGCDDSHRNAETKSAYSADYYFYAPNNNF
jgi:Protein of unknown function (DUF3455)